MSSTGILDDLQYLLPDLESIYHDIHAHPERSMHEERTAGIASKFLSDHGYDVTSVVGMTGVAGLLRNGDGATVMLRADMDALPDGEGATHRCGHDFHVTWLLGTSACFAKHRDAWNGTLVVVFQPGEETAQGARAMIDDGLLKRFPRPDVVLGQHVLVGPSGTVAGKAGPITSAADSLQIRLFGRGAHGSMPQASIDPVVMAASTVLRLQAIVSREVAASEFAVLTIGSLQAGVKENVIPDEALIKLNVRTLDDGVRKRVLDAIHRVVNAEAQASNAPRSPEITPLDSYPTNINDESASEKTFGALRAHFGDDRVIHTTPAPASEDFGCFGSAWDVPSVYWFVGGTDPDVYAKAKEQGKINELPVNHSPKFLPVLHPTLETGVEAMVMGALAWLGRSRL